ncbi:FecR family protein [Ascidiimonas aurantiaca]|uniref:FecR family protein n=1 Tax=Ascidiimonas aurantiaca TaxID=1685432 RepID=UPI0030EBF599
MDQIPHILIKKLSGTISPEEETLLRAWIDASEKNKKFFRKIERLKAQGQDLKKLENLDLDKEWETVLLKYRDRIDKQKRVKRQKILRIAAVFTGIAMIASIYLFTIDRGLEEVPENIITLELQNGTIKAIEADQPNEVDILDIQGNRIGTQQGNRIHYLPGIEDSGELVLNTLTVPYGKIFEILLADGSLLKLNSGSSATYPVRFVKGQNREVSLQGEAYFEVANNPEQPFIINTDKMNIRVLGTEFTVSSYPEDPDAHVVLVEGSVGVYETPEMFYTDQHTVLRPEQKASWNKVFRNIQVTAVNSKKYTAWTEGRLILEDLPFATIIKKLERKYNVRIINQNEALNKEVFTASFDIETIEQVLNSFAQDTPFNYRRTGSTITITK